MVPLLLLVLLLLPESLADQVCINISNGYDMKITLTNGTVVDKPAGDVRCEVENSPCLFQCTLNSMKWFNGSSVCLAARVTGSLPMVVYSIQHYGNCTLRLCEANVILPLIESLDRSCSLQRHMMQLLYIRDTCALLFQRNQMKKAFIKVEKRIILNIMKNIQIGTGVCMNYDLKALSLNVLNISEADLNSSGTSWILVAAPQPLNESYVSEVWLPVSSLQSIPAEERVVGLASYVEQSQFQLEQDNISSMVLRIELLEGQRLQNLSVPINITFKVAKHRHVNPDWLQCHYFDEQDSLWKKDGCQTFYNNQSEVMCSTNHATSFSILMIRPDQIDKDHWEIMSYISYIGCSLSAFFTAVSIVMYVFYRKYQTENSLSIHASLSGALFLLNWSFLLNDVVAASMVPDGVCIFLAAFMHYSLLCCFNWIAIEALHLYLLIIKVFNTHYKHYLLKLSLFGWGIPGVFVTISAAVKDVRQFYGVTNVSLASTDETSTICWITDDTFFYTSIGYFTLIFIFNSSILLAVACRICRKLRLSESCRRGLTVMGLTCLMGTTWGLVFLGSGYVSYPILYLFCILNSTQGFFIFLWVCQSAKMQRKQFMEDRILPTPMKTMPNPFSLPFLTLVEMIRNPWM